MSFQALWLVVQCWVDGELVEEFAGDGADDADLEVLDQHDDVGSGVGSSDADVSAFDQVMLVPVAQVVLGCC